MIKNTLVSIAFFSTFGLAYTTTKYIAEYKNKSVRTLNMIIKYSRNITLYTSGILAILLFLFAPYMALNILKAPHLEIPLRLVSAWIIFNALTSTQIGILSGFGSFKAMTKINAYVGVVTFILSIVFVYFWNLNGALLALLISQIINFYLNYRLIEKNRLKIMVDRESEKDTVSQKELLKYSFPIALQEGVFAISSWVISWFLINFSNYGELGLYSAAMQWATIVLFIPGILRNVILSHFSEVSSNRNAFDKILKRTLLTTLIAVIIPSIVVVVLSGFIASFYGETFKGLAIVIIMAILGVIPASLSNIYVQALFSKSKNWIVFYAKAATFCFTIGLSYLFVNIHLTESFALSVCIAVLLSNFIYLILLLLFYNLLIKNKENK